MSTSYFKYQTFDAVGHAYAIRDHLVSQGMRTLRLHALEKRRAGLATLEEVVWVAETI